MRISAGQQMRMEQTMKLSPRMIQSMEILQLPALALEERIEQELTENPTLEMAELSPEQSDHPLETADREDDGEGERPLHVGEEGGSDGDGRHDGSEDFGRAAELNDRYGESWSQNTQESAEFHTPVSSNGEPDAKMEAMGNTAARSAGLSDQLLEQWRLVDVTPGVRRAGEHLIEFIDADGYLRTPMEQVLRQAPPGVSEAMLEEALRDIQRSLEPTGIGARDLAQCLLLQLDALEAERTGGGGGNGHRGAIPIARRLVIDHLREVEMNRLPQIARRTGWSIEQIKQGLDQLRRLDPAPARRLAPEYAQVVIPDVIVEYDPVHDRYVAALNRGRSPGLRINPYYQEMAKDREQGKQTRKYLNENLNHARWLIDAVEQRNNTLLRVVGLVIEHQREFLDEGPEHLKPLPMVRVAEQLGVHVGTVSRTVSEKYIQTPRGVFPLRMFFSGGTESSEGDQMSWKAVQAKLKQVLDREDKRRPWSDDQLVEQMGKEGVEIARRTVAKYRKELGAPPARQRKQY